MATAPVIEQRARGIGILRVSDENDRGARLGSDREQEQSIRREAERRNIDLIDVLYERNVSGHTALERREFGNAIQRVERREAEVIIFAHRDRTDRSIEEGSKAIRRMDKAGGLLVAGGQVLSHQTAAQWREATFGSFLAEDYWRTTRERSMNGVLTRIHDAGIVPHQLPLGLLRNDDGSVRVDEELGPVVRDCFDMRARGETIAAIRAYLADQGIERSYRSVQIMLKSALYVGELRWPGLKKPVVVCDPVVDRHVWDAVQKMRVPSGRTAKSERLLARLGVLRCASCGGRMVAGGAWVKYTTAGGEERRTRYAFYKCGRGSNEDCPQPCAISAEKLERYVLDHVKGIYADGRGRASQARKAREAAARAERTKAKLGTATRRMMLLPEGEDDAVALAVIEELTAQLERESAEAERLASVSGIEVTNAATVLDSTDPDLLPHKRGLIRLALASITVSPGRAPVSERVGFEPLL